MTDKFSRRDFLKVVGVTSAGLALSACGVKATDLPPLSTATALPSLTPLPPTATATDTPEPTLTATPKPPTLRTLGEKLGLIIGTTLDGTDGYSNIKLQKTIGNHFGLMFTTGPIMPWVVEQYGWGTAKALRKIANNQDVIFHAQQVFYPRYFPERLKSANNKELVEYANTRIGELLALVNKIDSRNKPTYLTLVNEAIWEWQGNVGWYVENENPLYKVWGKKWISEVYLLLVEKAKSLGLTVGRDVILFYNDSHIFTTGKKANLIFDVLSTVKQEIAQGLGIPIEQVQLDVGSQLHFSLKPELSDPGNYWLPPTDDELLASVEKFSQIGKVHWTEFDIKVATQQERTEIMKHILTLAVKYHCASVTF